ncbi:MAG: M48 family metallopeptidase [Coriobacteriaceae bacterium]|jgi:predicted metal-dependent hydrolase|nr:M48 family metallopeptidase [Coriobacteriaceae bacterium]
MTRRPHNVPNPTEFQVAEVRVVLTRKKVKNINLRVKGPDGHASVSAPLWVTPERVEQFVLEKLPWIRRRQEAIARSPLHTGNKPTPDEKRFWRHEIEPRAKDLMDKWQPLIGVKAEKLDFRTMTSRWGSCNPQTGRVCINTRLALYPPQCLEYVVVHELCHLIERGHGPRFKALLDTHLPDWKARRALLR